MTSLGKVLLKTQTVQNIVKIIVKSFNIKIIYCKNLKLPVEKIIKTVLKFDYYTKCSFEPFLLCSLIGCSGNGTQAPSVGFRDDTD